MHFLLISDSEMFMKYDLTEGQVSWISWSAPLLQQDTYLRKDENILFPTRFSRSTSKESFIIYDGKLGTDDGKGSWPLSIYYYV